MPAVLVHMEPAVDHANLVVYPDSMVVRDVSCLVGSASFAQSSYDVQSFNVATSSYFEFILRNFVFLVNSLHVMEAKSAIVGQN